MLGQDFNTLYLLERLVTNVMSVTDFQLDHTQTHTQISVTDIRVVQTVSSSVEV